MSRSFLIKISLGLLVLAAIHPVFGIEPPVQAPDKRSFSESRWEKIKEGIDYSQETPPVKRKPSKGFDFNLPPGIGKAIVYIIVFALLVFILVKILQGNILLGDKKVKAKNTFSDAGTDEDVHESDLEGLYDQSLAARDFRLAVRYGYLIIIRELSGKQLIKWRREKTNSDYIFEMMNNVFEKPFREVTYLFEKVWYGKTELTEQNFLLVNSRFNDFISEMRNNRVSGGEAQAPKSDS